MSAALSRRGALKGMGALVVSVGAPLSAGALLGVTKAAAAGKPPLVPSELDSFIAVKADGSVSAFFGKIDVGHGLHTAIAQLVAEELDCPFENVTVLMGDTDTSVNQGGASGSTAISNGGKQMRAAAAEARRVLVERAAAKLNVAPEFVATSDGICAANGQSVSYGELIGDGYFNTQLAWNKSEGNGLYAPGLAKVKDAKNFKLIGQPLPRGDIAWKVFGTGKFVTDMRVPGMLHGRMLRPPVAGATPVAVDEKSVAHIPGVKIWRKGDVVGLTAPKEWDAVKAQRALKVTWSKVKGPFAAQKDIYDYIRKAPARATREDTNGKRGDVEALFAGGKGKIVEAEYEWPFQSHASMGGACALVQPTEDGGLQCWTGSQKPHGVRNGLSATFNIPREKIHVKWVLGPGSYGRNDADDCAADAALLALLSGKPVRVQYSRDQATGWNPKAPASVHKGRALLDDSGNVLAFDFSSKGFSLVDVAAGYAQAGDVLAGQWTGAKLNSVDEMGFPSQPYNFPAKRQSWATIAPQLDRASPLRSSHMRDPGGPQIAFASESFIDEVAVAAKSDPIQFRLRYLDDPRAIAAIKKAAELFGWQSRVSPAPKSANGPLIGRGFAYGDRNGTKVAICAEVSVDRKTGKVTPTRVAVAHDCGQIVNPRSLHTTVEAGLLQGLSRGLKEEVRFSPETVTSVDWVSYPVLNSSEVPKIDIALIDNPGLPMTGAGEASARPAAAALANAVFDATGVRVRRAPVGQVKLPPGVS
jgi:CO/xanthine dehydrogenase Mo-binding subunit